MSILVMAHVFAADMKTPTRKAVLLAIADHCDDNGENSFQSHTTLAQKANVSRRTVIRCCAEFIEEKLLEVAGKIPCESGYTINYTVKLSKLLGKKWCDTESHLPNQGVTEAVSRCDTESQHEGQGVTESVRRCDTVSHNPSNPSIYIYFEKFYDAYPKTRFATRSKALAFFEKLTDADKKQAIEASKVYARITKKSKGKFITSPQRFLEERMFTLSEYQPPKTVLAVQAPEEGTAERKLYCVVIADYGESVWVSWFGPDKIAIVDGVVIPSSKFIGSKIEQNYSFVLEAAGLTMGTAR